jgi:hypothetical protein
MKVDIAATVQQIQGAGIEVMAGFIFGSDQDTIETAGAIASFASKVAIPTAMTGMLTPIPFTPLHERLRSEGRLREAEYSGNNTDDEVQFVPQRMSVAEMQNGYYQILERLFAPGAMFARSSALLGRLEPHIFHGGVVKPADLRAALRSLWLQGVVRGSRVDYGRLLWSAVRRDGVRLRAARRALDDLERRRASLRTHTGTQPELVALVALVALVDRASDAMVRAEPSRPLDEIGTWAAGVKERLAVGTATPDDVQLVCDWSREYFQRQQRLHKFPGAYLVKAFNLAIKGLHYETVMHGIARDGQRAAVVPQR